MRDDRHVVLGATGHVGSAVAGALLDRGEGVTAVLHDPADAAAWEARGARAVVVDLRDAEALRAVLRDGTTLFLLNPPAAPSTDTDVEERRTLHAILAAVDGSDLRHVVAQSTYGAQPGRRVGDLGVLHEMEQALGRLSIATTVLRAAYYLSNWDHALESAPAEGVVRTFYPVDFELPMVAPADLGAVAAERLVGPPAHDGPLHVEGPRRYTAIDVAAAFARALDRPVRAEATPRAAWPDALRQLGFSTAAANSFIGMTTATLEHRHEPPSPPIRGSTTLDRYVAQRVARPA